MKWRRSVLTASAAWVLTAAATYVLTAAAACALLAATAARAQPAMTAGDLAQLCAGSDHVSRNACRIYILGVTQGITLGLSLAEGQRAAHRPCVPANISAEKLEETLKKRLAGLDHPQRDRDAAGYIGSVLAAAYPCTRP